MIPDLKNYLDPVSIEPPVYNHLPPQAGFPHNITVHTENSALNDIGNYRIALLGVPEGRNSPDQGTAKAPDLIREQLYALAKIPGKSRIIDLGNMKQGVTFNDTLAGLSDVLSVLLSENVFPVLIGGSSSVIPAIDRSLSAVKTKYTLVAVDPRIDYSSEKTGPGSYSYLNTLFHNDRSAIGHYINIGYQTYLNDQQVINRFNRQQAELFRIGDVRQAIHLTEPLFRDSDLALFDISAVRQSDAPGTTLPSPNGFYGEEICLLARYAGISDTLKLFGLFDVNPLYDERFRTTGLAAQVIWFFLEGFAQKQYETPLLDDSATGRFTRYHVSVADMNEDLIFVKSTLTERWWIELNSENSGKLYVACSHEDYLKANRSEVPDRWVKASNRLKC
ncbi:MAG: arginase family protein [Bacteroidales bacterium]